MNDGTPQPQPNDRARQAIEKMRSGKPLNSVEQRALDAHRKRVEQWNGEKFLHAIPKKLWVQMSGRQHKVLDEQADLYGFPLRGETIDLAAFAKFFHDFIAENGHKLLSSDESEIGGQNSPALERLRDAKAKIAELDLLEMQKKLLPIEKVTESHALIANVLRQAAEQLDRQGDTEARAVLEDAISAAAREVDSLLGETKEEADDDHES